MTPADQPPTASATELSAALGPVRRSPGTAIELAQALLALFTSGDYTPGQRLPGERHLAEQLGVGRSTMREAMKSLAVLGIIDVRQGDGTFLRRNASDLLPRMVEWGVVLGDRSVASLAEARHHVEVALAGLAAARRTPETLAPITAALDAMRRATEAGDVAAYSEADIDFHLSVARAADNEVLSGILGNTRVLLQTWTTRVLHGSVTLPESLAVHVPVHEGIAAGDVDASRDAMDRHMRAAVQNLQRVLDGTARGGR